MLPAPDDNGNRVVERALASVSAPGVAASAIAATVDWGDGATSAGVVSGTAATSTSVNGLYTISGSHDYGPGHHDYSPTVTVTAPGTAAVTIQVTVRK